MHPRLRRDAATRHGSECRLQSLGCGGDFLFHHDAPGFFQNAVAAGAIPRSRPMVKLDCENFLLRFVAAAFSSAVVPRNGHVELIPSSYNSCAGTTRDELAILSAIVASSTPPCLALEWECRGMH